MDEQRMDPKAARQLRGLLLTLVYLNHNRQGGRLTSTVLRGTLQREGYQFSRPDILTILQDLKDRQFLRYEQMRDPEEHAFIFNIEITARGRDLVDGMISDPAVLTQ